MATATVAGDCTAHGSTVRPDCRIRQNGVELSARLLAGTTRVAETLAALPPPAAAPFPAAVETSTEAALSTRHLARACYATIASERSRHSYSATDRRKRPRGGLQPGRRREALFASYAVPTVVGSAAIAAAVVDMQHGLAGRTLRIGLRGDGTGQSRGGGHYRRQRRRRRRFGWQVSCTYSYFMCVCVCVLVLHQSKQRHLL